MKPDELKIILEQHKAWLETGGEEGERANLWRADLRLADLKEADLQGADLRRTRLLGADLRGAYLQEADLHGANLWEANLRGANFDFSCFPLWCGGAHFKADLRLVYQLLAHVCTLEVEGKEFEDIKEKILPYAKKSHRAADLGLIKEGT